MEEKDSTPVVMKEEVGEEAGEEEERETGHWRGPDSLPSSNTRLGPSPREASTRL